MALIIKNCLHSLRNVNKVQQFIVFSRYTRKWSRVNNIYIEQRTNAKFTSHHRWIHVTNAANKIVAFKLSDIGEGIREVVIKEWFVKVGDKVQQFDNICEVQSDKASVTITSRYDGVVTRLYNQVDETAMVGNPLVDIEMEDATEDSQTQDPIKTVGETIKTSDANNSVIKQGKVLTTPSVRRIASQFKVDLSTVQATGRNGRLLKEDLLAYLNMTSDKSNEVPEPAKKSIPKYTPTRESKSDAVTEDKVVPVSGFTKAMVKSMTEAMKIPHFGFSDEYNVTKLVELRESLKQLARDKGVKLTYMPIIVKAVSLSLHTYPILNSSLDSTYENLIYKISHNIGVAMDTPNGLVVPVIKNVQNKSIIEISHDLNHFQEKGAKGQLGLSDISGGTFTISNIGIVGGTYTKPIILPPQVSIGALGKIQVLPRFDEEGNVTKAHILTVSWSADHRVIDGVTMARFSNQVKDYLENPNKLLLDL
ncbi:lipoamide acyltransferase component of branched-chain alpha-keto acid dehydrogenase complex, mitochondrial [Leptidea sinapis]|uniref:lipoamide acyltransferase component of branched-chain alpha-keto acid dehydrogenase complex, mitochondrial n=1 Tax=Leptidea sinapis TaxID=189913 RepID=UPI0021C39389|nr:lipoamide acyltransferase component of branched-chain alpha-keto acid dehydrogenase complex, mitochondrial [Leptidea sinapis]